MKIHKNVIVKGFTMIELLVVISILGVLASIGFATFTLVNRKTAEKETKIIIENVSAQLTSYVSNGDGNLPIGTGSSGSTEDLVKILAGGETSDSIDAILSDDDRVPLLPKADPAYEGNGKMVQEIDGTWVLVDGFGNEMFYRGPDNVELINNVENGFDLWSEGADGSDDNSGDEDDITNW